jgi:hypothetical protein
MSSLQQKIQSPIHKQKRLHAPGHCTIHGDETWTTELNSLQGGSVKDLLKLEVQKRNGKHAEAT